MSKRGGITRKARFECTPSELAHKVERYFSDCEENSRKPTAPGLCVALGISVSDFRKVLAGASPRYLPYARVLEAAQLRIIDDIEQRTDSMSVSRAKLPVYSIGNEAKGGGVSVKIELRGMKKGEEPFK